MSYTRIGRKKIKNRLVLLWLMIKVAMIGAGSLVFGETLLTDILTYPTLRDDIILCLEDKDPQRLDLMYRYMTKYREDNYTELKNVVIEKTTDQQKEKLPDETGSFNN